MKSKLNNTGYLMIDNRNASVPDELTAKAGLPDYAGRGLFEAATYTCNHCHAVVLMNPARTRERGYCRGCDHYICDACATVRARTLECKTMNRVIDEVLTAAEKQTPEANSPILLLR